jgi:ribosomal protein S27AE
MSDTERTDVTHYKWICGECENVVWLPVESLGSQADHDERLFCGCEDNGVRMNRIHGKEGEVCL